MLAAAVTLSMLLVEASAASEAAQAVRAVDSQLLILQPLVVQCLEDPTDIYISGYREPTLSYCVIVSICK